MAKITDMPKFGNLQGIRVFANVQSIAGPFMAALMAEQGADVIWNEYNFDAARNSLNMCEQNRKNMRSIALNWSKPEAREAFLRVVKYSDIFIETTRGGHYAKKGITDEVLWEANPKLVIIHVSGYGQWGDPAWVSRPSWDAVAQATSGYMNFIGFPDGPPMPGQPYPCDFFTALFGVYAALSGYIRAKETGKGESVDVAQYEVMMRVDSSYWCMHATSQWPIRRTGTGNPSSAAMDNYKCKDGNMVCVLLNGFVAFKGGMKALGLDYPSAEWPEPPNKMYYIKDSDEGNRLEKVLEEFCANHTVEEVDKILSEAGVPVSPIMTYELMKRNPHFQKREVFTQWEAMDGRTVTGINMFPKFKNNPSKLWRVCPTQGLDTEDVMTEIGYSREEIDDMYEKKILRKEPQDISYVYAIADEWKNIKSS
jgi:L-carnitine CoA-transferase